MRAAFERVLASYPLLAGRFVAQADGTVEIVQGDATTDLGVPFVEATSDLRLDDLPLSPEQYTSCSVVPSSLQLLRPFIASDALNQPPVMLQHTRFACGSVCLGVHMHHWLVDGEAYFTVLRDWRSVYERMGQEEGGDGARGALLEPPCLDRSSLHPRCSQSELLAEAAQFRQDAYELPSDNTIAAASPSSSQAAPAPAAPAPFCLHRVLRFTAPELERMRAAASDPEAGCTAPWISTFEALSAHMLRCVHRARHPELYAHGDLDGRAGASGKSDVIMSGTVTVGIRGRTEPPLPARLFANAVLKVCAAVPLSSSSLGATASAMHAAIAGLDAAAVHRALCWVSAAPNKAAIRLVEDPLDRLSLVSWTRFGTYAPDGPTSLAFEPGCPPLRVSFNNTPQGVNGLMTVMETPTGQEQGRGALEVHIGLLRDDMLRMIDGPLLRQFA